MKLRPLGKGGPAVSEIGLGTSQLSNVDGLFDGGKPISRTDAEAILHGAVAAGINFFDTADNYGAAEDLLGALPQSAKRSVTIATKAGLRDDGERDFSEAYLRSRVERSLRRLQVDALDLFQLNKPSAEQLADGRLFDLFDRLKAEGKIRRSGLIVGTPASGEVATASGKVDSLQVLYNLVVLECEPLIARAAAAGVAVLVRSPLNSGLLSGTYTAATVFGATDERSGFFAGAAFNKRVAAVQAIMDELGVVGDQLVEYALRFLLSNPAVTAVLPGASSMAQMQRYAAMTTLPRLTATELDRARAAVARHTADVPGTVQFLGAVPTAPVTVDRCS